MPKQYLIPDLIPKTSWFDNLRSVLSQEEWDIVRRSAYRASGWRCAICGGSGKEQGFDWPVECHEKWEFDDLRGKFGEGTQYLTGVQALCPMCHKVKHWGLSIRRDAAFANSGLRWMAQINDWTEDAASAVIRGCMQQWQERSKKQWLVDYSRAPQNIQEMVRGMVDWKQEQKVRYDPADDSAFKKERKVEKPKPRSIRKLRLEE